MTGNRRSDRPIESGKVAKEDRDNYGWLGIDNSTAAPRVYAAAFFSSDLQIQTCMRQIVSHITSRGMMTIA